MLLSEKFEDVIHLRMSREHNGQPLYWTSAFFVDGILIDTGPSYTAQELKDFLITHPPKMIVNTHYHEDHIGGNHLLSETFGCPIYASQNAIPLIATRPRLHPYQELVWGYPEPSCPLPLSEEIETGKYTFLVVPTPGHSVDHITLVEKERGWFFTGDLIPGERVKTIRREEKIEEIISSIAKLRKIKTQRMILFSGTGRIFFDGRKTTDMLLSYLSDLKDKVADCYYSGLRPAEIVERLFGGEDPRRILTQDQFSIENLVQSIIEAIESKSLS
ncbi:MAG: MBL fold metallo-hydrolase [Syntrophales bacterium]|nr:MBL fold metallo-hydrolase [Syntrophales bacterium]